MTLSMTNRQNPKTGTVPTEIEPEIGAYASMDLELQNILRVRFASLLKDSKVSLSKRNYKQKAQGIFSAFKGCLRDISTRKTYLQIQADKAENLAKADVSADDPMTPAEREQYDVRRAIKEDMTAAVVTQNPLESLHDLRIYINYTKDLLCGNLLTAALDPLYVISKEHGVCADHILHEINKRLSSSIALITELQTSVCLLQKESRQYKAETESLAKWCRLLTSSDATAASLASPPSTGPAAEPTVSLFNKPKSHTASVVYPGVAAADKDEDTILSSSDIVAEHETDPSNESVLQGPKLEAVPEFEIENLNTEELIESVDNPVLDRPATAGDEVEEDYGDENDGTIEGADARPRPPNSIVSLGQKHRIRQHRKIGNNVIHNPVPNIPQESILDRAKALSEKSQILATQLLNSEKDVQQRAQQRAHELEVAQRENEIAQAEANRQAFLQRGHRQALVSKNVLKKKPTTGSLDKYTAVGADQTAILKLEQASRQAAFRTQQESAKEIERSEAEMAVLLLEEQIKRLTAQLERTKDSLLTPKQRKQREEEEAAKLAEIRARVETRQRQHMAKLKLTNLLRYHVRRYKDRRKRRLVAITRIQRWARFWLFWLRVRFRVRTKACSYFLACCCYRLWLLRRRRRIACATKLQRFARACQFRRLTRKLMRSVLRAAHAKAAAFCKDQLQV